MAQITIPLPTIQHWRTTLFGLVTAAGGAIVQYWQNGGLSWRECAVAAIWAAGCALMADGHGTAATDIDVARALAALAVDGNAEKPPIDGGAQA